MRQCDRCGKVIRFLPSSQENKLTEYVVRGDGTRGDARWIVVSVCMWCVIRERIIKWLQDHLRLVVGVILCVFTLIWVYAARSQETIPVYQNPDFPCVRAINPTVTDSACETAIARRH
jgi:hypothetical protein